MFSPKCGAGGSAAATCPKPVASDLPIQISSYPVVRSELDTADSAVALGVEFSSASDSGPWEIRVRVLQPAAAGRDLRVLQGLSGSRPKRRGDFPNRAVETGRLALRCTRELFVLRQEHVVSRSACVQLQRARKGRRDASSFCLPDWSVAAHWMPVKAHPIGGSAPTCSSVQSRGTRGGRGARPRDHTSGNTAGGRKAANRPFTNTSIPETKTPDPSSGSKPLRKSSPASNAFFSANLWVKTLELSC